LKNEAGEIVEETGTSIREWAWVLLIFFGGGFDASRFKMRGWFFQVRVWGDEDIRAGDNYL
jgi:hypothetical protein